MTAWKRWAEATKSGGLQWKSTFYSLITCSGSDKGACGSCQGQGWGGRPGFREEAGAGEVWKMSKHNGPLGPPLPWPQDHWEKQRVPVFNTDPSENQSKAAFRLKPEFRRTSVSWCGEELGGEEGDEEGWGHRKRHVAGLSPGLAWIWTSKWRICRQKEGQGPVLWLKQQISV